MVICPGERREEERMDDTWNDDICYIRSKSHVLLFPNAYSTITILGFVQVIWYD
jgi:hypothetical protein